jgi:hypothetical protein
MKSASNPPLPKNIPAPNPWNQWRAVLHSHGFYFDELFLFSPFNYGLKMLSVQLLKIKCNQLFIQNYWLVKGGSTSSKKLALGTMNDWVQLDNRWEDKNNLPKGINEIFIMR